MRGVTYGSFRRRRDGAPFPEPERVSADLDAIASSGLNTIRTYALPPADVFAAVAETNLRLIVGLEYRDWRFEPEPGPGVRRRVLAAGRRAIYEAVTRCAVHPEVVALLVGNEVPADVVRLHGFGSVEETLSTLVAEVHAANADLLVAYANGPSTEHLRIEGTDLLAYNLFLDSPQAFSAYVRGLQVADDRPLVLTELGFAAKLVGEAGQAGMLDRQLRLSDELGVAGVAVFSWTDERALDGRPVEGLGFGLTDAARQPRRALDTVRAWASLGVRDLRPRWPRISVVVCAFNEAGLIGRCLASLERCEYPELEVIVCDDGSTDQTLEVARTFPFTVLPLSHGGLGRARNAGIEAASGEIVAFLDADAECHPEWPYRLALALDEQGVGATGGPDILPTAPPFLERAVAASPGGPQHVLVSSCRADHLPGCNIAFRRTALEEIGGFDQAFTSAGGDVDACWRLLDAGHEIAFSPAAQVRHHRPATVGGYLSRQQSYGRSERLLGTRHPERASDFDPLDAVARRLPLTVFLVAGAALAPLSSWALLGPVAAIAILLAYAAAVAATAHPGRGEPNPMRFRLVVAGLHALAPFARTWGRLQRARTTSR